MRFSLHGISMVLWIAVLPHAAISEVTRNAGPASPPAVSDPADSAQAHSGARPADPDAAPFTVAPPSSSATGSGSSGVRNETGPDASSASTGNGFAIDLFHPAQEDPHKKKKKTPDEDSPDDRTDVEVGIKPTSNDKPEGDALSQAIKGSSTTTASPAEDPLAPKYTPPKELSKWDPASPGVLTKVSGSPEIKDGNYQLSLAGNNVKFEAPDGSIKTVDKDNVSFVKNGAAVDPSNMTPSQLTDFLNTGGQVKLRSPGGSWRGG
jgi:hypothetical protein